MASSLCLAAAGSLAGCATQPPRAPDPSMPEAPRAPGPSMPDPSGPDPSMHAPSALSDADPASEVPPGTLKVGAPGLDQTKCPSPGFAPYPAEARQNNIEGLVIARCIIEVDGSLTCASRRSDRFKTEPVLEKAVLVWLAKARVQPFTAKGEPVRVICNYPFRYKLE